MMIKVFGNPAPKGSLKCVGRGGRHQLVEDNDRTAPWRTKVTVAGRQAVAKYGRLNGPIVIEATFTIARPATVPLAKRPYPTARSAGDVDKLLRLIFDALDDAGLYGDDSQIVGAQPWKAYPDSPGIVDRLDRPGALIRIEQL